jgi:hypothetical protein
MAILKLTESGSSLTLHVTAGELVEGQYGEQIKFTATNGDLLFLPRASADRQLFRCGFGTEDAPGHYEIHYDEIAGSTLCFTRDANPKMPTKPYWGITKVAADAPRGSLAERGKAEAEKVRQQKGLPADSGPSMGRLPYDDAPPPTDADAPYDEEDGLPPVNAGAAVKAQDQVKDAKRQAVVEAYRYAVAAAHDIWGPDTEASVVQAASATILIAMQKHGVA